MSLNKGWSLEKTGIVAALIAMAAITTMMIRVPIPATTGYFNIGDIFVILAGLWLGPVAGLLVGAIGPTIADAIGFPVFIPATMITKGLEGLIAGLIGGGANSQNIGRKIAAAIAAGATMVAGYFVFEAYIYPSLAKSMPIFGVTDVGAAIVELGPNSVQAIIGVIGAVALWKLVSGYGSQGGHG